MNAVSTEFYSAYRDIPPLMEGYYVTDVPLDFLWNTLDGYEKDYGLDMDPAFQRHHVWNVDQQIAFVEHVLRGGRNTTIRWNCKNWMGKGEKGPVTLVDGKQRLTAVLMFLSNDLPAFGTKIADFEDRMTVEAGLQFRVNNLKTDEEVLRWYLEINSGNVAHTDEELRRVQEMLRRERLANRED